MRSAGPVALALVLGACFSPSVGTCDLSVPADPCAADGTAVDSSRCTGTCKSTGECNYGGGYGDICCLGPFQAVGRCGGWSWCEDGYQLCATSSDCSVAAQACLDLTFPDGRAKICTCSTSSMCLVPGVCCLISPPSLGACGWPPCSGVQLCATSSECTGGGTCDGTGECVPYKDASSTHIGADAISDSFSD